MRRLVPALLLLAAACGDRPAAEAARADSAPPGRVVDSILPMDELLRRFRADLPEVTALEGGAPSRDSLVAAILARTSANDTLGLASLVLTRREFGWLYFPRHIYVDPPYELDPAIYWIQIQSGSTRGFDRLLGYRGGARLTLQGYSCEPSEAVKPPLEEWKNCELRLVVDGQERREQLFGTIVGLEGRYKVTSFANQF